jgi:hypothetical protein
MTSNLTHNLYSVTVINFNKNKEETFKVEALSMISAIEEVCISLCYRCLVVRTRLHNAHLVRKQAKIFISN